MSVSLKWCAGPKEGGPHPIGQIRRDGSGRRGYMPIAVLFALKMRPRGRLLRFGTAYPWHTTASPFAPVSWLASEYPESRRGFT